MINRRRNFRQRNQKNNFRRRNGSSNNNNNNFNNGNLNYSRNGLMSNPHSVEKAIQKFQQLAKDAQSSGDLVLVENYLQHADHYSRRLAELNEKIVSNNNERKPLNTDIQNDSSSLNVNEEKQTSS